MKKIEKPQCLAMTRWGCPFAKFGCLVCAAPIINDCPNAFISVSGYERWFLSKLGGALRCTHRCVDFSKANKDTGSS